MLKIKKKTQWLAEEISLLRELYPLSPSKKWKFIAREFEERGFNRSELECREKWINFVDPSINSRRWEQAELETLYSLHEKYGTRWCVVQKEIGRTQNKIKNRFYGTLRNYIRYVIGNSTQKNIFYNYEISKLNPKILNEIYHGEYRFAFFKRQAKTAIYAMNFRVNKALLAARIISQKEIYAQLAQTILSYFQQSKNILKPAGTQENGQIKIQERFSEREETINNRITFEALESGQNRNQPLLSSFTNEPVVKVEDNPYGLHPYYPFLHSQPYLPYPPIHPSCYPPFPRPYY